LFYISLDFTF